MNLPQTSVFRSEDSKQIEGKALNMLIHNMTYHYTEVKVYEDGMVDCWGLVDLDGFKNKIKEGWIVTEIPEGGELSLPNVGILKVKESIHSFPTDDLVTLVEDTIAKLNGTYIEKSKICLEAYQAYLSEPTQENKEALRIAYEAVPRYERAYLGDQDVKDIPIRMAIYGEDEIENWSHRKAAKQMGLKKLPFIKLPWRKKV
ncbi:MULTISPECIES: hypothetical protein [unclassified Lentimonas]|uniref:DUF7638 domain-containing protein n=1 Tax=unclassified Lentimonas TaxID=2630993 RepID=UPI001324060C|nr:MULTISPECIES: hypothetical protein [unclassified Lentimonas]CAA6696726.1 Unannotated [Lentimonas sp. CC10]CAA6697338.1 Unannotated [Lentimonas sp. CC19]CAA7072249.1 Unannotated [Lentimonas sp. CC11]